VRYAALGGQDLVTLHLPGNRELGLFADEFGNMIFGTILGRTSAHTLPGGCLHTFVVPHVNRGHDIKVLLHREFVETRYWSLLLVSWIIALENILCVKCRESYYY